tara:strand:+ start:2014 stop:3636 length:1623 start_codon:yes stop_codon:yes gene_type:complete
MSDLSLKLQGTNGDLQEFDSDGNKYLAYQAGLRLAESAKTEVAAITDVSSGNQTIGAFTDTRFNQIPGTHGGLTQTTTTTTLYQTEGIAPETDSDIRNPIHYTDSDVPEIHEMSSTEIDSLADKLNLILFANDYPGTYQLGSSAPSGDYDTHLSAVFTDTRTDEDAGDPSTVTVNTYNIYQRQTMTAPTKINAMTVKRSSGRTGTFQGLQAMTDRQIKYSMGQRCKTRIMNGAYGVGTYRLRSATQGAPSESGTWVAKGTAVDTRHTTTDTNYTQDFVGTFEQVFEQNFTQDFVGTFETTFTGTFETTFTGTFETNYITSTFETDFVGTFETDYVGNPDIEYVGAYIGNPDIEYIGNPDIEYIGNPDINYVGNPDVGYIGNPDINYIRYNSAWGNYGYVYYTGPNYVGNPAINYIGNPDINYIGNPNIQYIGNPNINYIGNPAIEYIGNYIGNPDITYTGTFESTYTGGFVGDFIGTFETDYTGTFETDFVGTFESTYTGDFIGTFAQTFETTFTGDFIGTLINTGTATVETYTLYVRTV